MKAVILNEVHFQRTFTFGGIPMCQLPAHFIESEDLLRRYMGEYRDLSTDCSVRSESNQEVAEVRGVRDLKLVENRRRDGVVKKSGGRARFNWQDRKRFDLKGHPEACKQCELVSTCEGVWQGYLDIWGDSELRAFQRSAERLA